MTEPRVPGGSDEEDSGDAAGESGENEDDAGRVMPGVPSGSDGEDSEYSPTAGAAADPGDAEAETDAAPASTTLELPCGESIDALHGVDMGQREFDCACGARHAVVMDVHPPSRFVPEDVVAALRDAVDVAAPGGAGDDGEGGATDAGEFGTVHIMGMVIEEFPDGVASADVSDEGSAGYAMVWVTDRDARALHEVVVELLVELMDHAVGHAAEDGGAGGAQTGAEFDEQLHAFDVSEFVEQYRAMRDLEDEHDRVV